MKYVLAFIAFALTTLLSGGCSGSKEQVLVWPDPPDEARVQYVRTLRGEEDFRGAMGKALSEVAGEQNVIHLSRPYDVCVAGGGRVYVTDVSQGVFLFDLEKGEVEVLGEKSSIDLRNPRGIAYGKGNVFLSLPDLGQVLVLDDEGKDLRTIGARGQFTGLVDVVCDTARNRLILVDNKLHNVLVYSMAGDSLFELGTRGEGDSSTTRRAPPWTKTGTSTSWTPSISGWKFSTPPASTSASSGARGTSSACSTGRRGSPSIRSGTSTSSTRCTRISRFSTRKLSC
jgi:hypothetical protein